VNLANFPKTVLDFESRFPYEAACVAFLYESKWPNGFVCPKCGGRKSYFVVERGREQCAACKKQTSVTAGTLFHGQRAGLRKWFRAILEFVVRKHGCNALDIHRLVGVSEPIALQWLKKFREALGRRDRTPLTGSVEVDETYVGGPERGVHGRNRGAKKILVTGAVEIRGNGCGRARLEPTKTAAAEDLQPFVVDHVELGAEVRTDKHAGYRSLDEAYKHRVRKIGDPKTASKKFPRIHRVFSLFKRNVLGIYQGSWRPKFAASYCHEFEFRFNRRDTAKRPLLFAAIVACGLKGAPSIFRKPRGSLASALTT
jgi:transposase-like protein